MSTPIKPLISTSLVAQQKGCTGMAVRNAVKRGDLNAVKVGPTWAIADDEILAAWTVRETGGRYHKGRSEESDDSANAG